MHKIKGRGLVIDKFHLLRNDDNEGHLNDFSADMKDISGIELSKSFSEVVTSSVEFNNANLPLLQQFDPIQEESIGAED